MAHARVLIFHRPAADGERHLVRLLADARARLVGDQADLFLAAGADDVRVETGWLEGASFGSALSALAPATGGLIVFGSGAAPRLHLQDARQLVAVAGSGQRRALTNNRYSSDICAVGDGAALRRLPDLPSDNALPRWLEERAGFKVAELAGRRRLALDLDTPLDVALAAAAPGAARWLRALVEGNELAVPRRDDLRRLAADPRRELLVFGRAGSHTLGWLERNVRCRVRFLSEERGLRAATALATGPGSTVAAPSRPPRATLGRLLEQRGPQALADIVAELGDGAVLDTRVLLADHLTADESAWPSHADRFASDLLQPAEIEDPWLRRLTAAAADSRLPILLGAHTLVGPGIPIVLAGAGRA